MYLYIAFQVGKLKNMGKIQTWSDHIINHFWYCASICKSPATASNEEALKVMKVMLLSCIHLVEFVNFPQIVNSQSNVTGEIINMPRARDKEKIRVPDRNRTHDLQNTGRVLYSVSCANPWRARPLY